MNSGVFIWGHLTRWPFVLFTSWVKLNNDDLVMPRACRCDVKWLLEIFLGSDFNVCCIVKVVGDLNERVQIVNVHVMFTF